MADLPHPWGTYARTQAQLSRQTTFNDIADGLEAGLNRFLDEVGRVDRDPTASLPRVIASAGRRSRYIRRMHAQGRIPGRDSPDTWMHLEARADLARLTALLADADAALLVAVASGHSYGRLAPVFAADRAALRAKVSRSRRTARQALGH